MFPSCVLLFIWTPVGRPTLMRRHRHHHIVMTCELTVYRFEVCATVVRFAKKVKGVHEVALTLWWTMVDQKRLFCWCRCVAPVWIAACGLLFFRRREHIVREFRRSHLLGLHSTGIPGSEEEVVRSSTSTSLCGWTSPAKIDLLALFGFQWCGKNVSSETFVDPRLNFAVDLVLLDWFGETWMSVSSLRTCGWNRSMTHIATEIIVFGFGSVASLQSCLPVVFRLFVPTPMATLNWKEEEMVNLFKAVPPELAHTIQNQSSSMVSTSCRDAAVEETVQAREALSSVRPSPRQRGGKAHGFFCVKWFVAGTRSQSFSDVGKKLENKLPRCAQTTKQHSFPNSIMHTRFETTIVFMFWLVFLLVVLLVPSVVNTTFHICLALRHLSGLRICLGWARQVVAVHKWFQVRFFFVDVNESVLATSPIIRQCADTDYQRHWHHMRHRHLRRSCPPWSPPPEIWRQQYSTGRAGVGAEALEDKHHFRCLFRQLLVSPRTHPRVPAAWNVSATTQLPKHSGKRGCSSLRRTTTQHHAAPRTTTHHHHAAAPRTTTTHHHHAPPPRTTTTHHHHRTTTTAPPPPHHHAPPRTSTT